MDDTEAMRRPDYGGYGIANLMASVVAGLGRAGERSACAPCPALAAQRLREARHVVVLVIDGLGRAQLDRHAPGGAIAQAVVADLSSVFPSTTASAITTFMTADPPRTHGLTGWHVWFRALGVVGAPLPFRVRGSDVGLDRLGVDAASLFGDRPLSARLARRCVVVHPQHLARSHYTLAHAPGADIRTFKRLDELAASLVALAREREPSYCYAYWPELDALSHVHGAASAQAGEHLAEIDAMLDALHARLAGTGTLLAVCADHGFVDTRADTRLRLEDHPALARTLALPLCGEPRAAICEVRAGAGPDFEAYVAEHLGGAARAVASSTLIEDGWLGPGEPHPDLRWRMGTHVLLMQGAHCIVDRVAGERRPFTQVGVHGGMSDAELRVPLALFGA